jgi:hypothetical protein
MGDLLDLVRRSLDPETATEFDRRVADQAEEIRQGLAAGRFDNADFAVGLEVEVYAIDAEPEPPTPEEDDEDAEADAADPDADLSESGDAVWDGSLESVEEVAERDANPDAETAGQPDQPYMDPAEWEGRLRALSESVFEGPAAKELGLHNAEVNTDPNALYETGLEVQTTAVEMRIAKARDAAAAENAELVLDAMWTIPPEGGSKSHLGDVTERDGVVVAENMRRDPRYVAIENDALRHAGGEIPFSVPGAAHDWPSILFESLTTSIQPHLQIPTAAAFPAYYNAAIRTLGPVLSLTTNSPFLPADLYNEVGDPYDLLAATHHELRIATFEQSVNTTEEEKVRVPRDIDEAGDVTRRVVEDDLFAPVLREWMADGPRNSLDARHWEFDHKRGTYWRWLRAVVGGDPIDDDNDEYSLRIEYRPIPTQPTAKDIIAAQTFTAGLLRGLVHADHPLAELPWADARRSFYSAAREGMDADLAWVTADGQRTTDTAVIYDELFEYARRGLRAEDVPKRRVEEFLDPLERRRAAGVTPSAWKIERVRECLDDGATLEDAIQDAQREYYELSRAEQCFADWL